MSEIAISILGNAAERRTEAELYWQSDGKQEFVALVYDTRDGWKTEIENTQRVAAIGADFDNAVERARERLASYVNRTGENIPEGLTIAGLSLWLMEKADGTAMGRPVHE